MTNHHDALGQNAALVHSSVSGIIDDEAIALARASIDRCEACSENGRGESLSAQSEELEHLSAALELVGRFQSHQGADAHAVEIPLPVTLGRFQIRGERGRGGFGIVLRAFDPHLDREVALKIPRPERLLGGHARAEFVREAQLAAKLEHSGIVRVYEAGQLGPVWYIASEYCAGPTLADWSEHNPDLVSAQVAAQLVAEIAAAVHFAHTRGVLHLDLKPENILLELPAAAGTLPRTLVTDFGLAGRTDGNHEGKAKRIAGTLAYMAPEQRVGDASQIGIAADVYALGAILQELLQRSGTLGPASGSDSPPANTAMPQRAAVRVPQDLVAICEKCRRDEPSERYLSAHDVAADLHCFLRGEGVVARQAAWPERMIRWGRRRPVVATLVGLLVFCVMFSTLMVTYLWRQAEANLRDLRAEQQVHARTASQMRSSLLNLTWLTQEFQLQPMQRDVEAEAQIRLLREFCAEVDHWTRGTADEVQQKALQAAGHGLAMVDETTCSSQQRLDEEFVAGLEAWKAVIAHAPDDPRWHRALALHVLSYSIRSNLAGTPYWRFPRPPGPALEPDLVAIIEEPYALLLVDMATKVAARSDLEGAHDMLRNAVALLEVRQHLPDPNQVRLYALLVGYKQLAEVSHRLSLDAESSEAVRHLELLATKVGPPEECPPRVALAVGEMHRIRAGQFHRLGNQHAESEALRAAIPFVRRACASFPKDASIAIRLSNLHRRLAEIHANFGEHGAAADEYRLAIAVVDDIILRLPGHRNLILHRTRLFSDLAQSLRASDDIEGAIASLAAAASDYQGISFSNHDSRRRWLYAIECTETLGQLYAKTGKTAEAIWAYKQCLALLERAKPRFGVQPSFIASDVRSRRALATLRSAADQSKTE